jgi:hypothetical protein
VDCKWEQVDGTHEELGKMLRESIKNLGNLLREHIKNLGNMLREGTP